MKILPVGAELFRTEGRTDMTKLTIAFRNFPNAPKKTQRLTSLSGSSNALWLQAARSQVIGYFWIPLECYGSDKRHYSATTHAERVLFRFV